MRRPARPFTVEIKSSRNPVSIRKPVLLIPDRPRTEPLPQDFLEDAREPLPVRSPAHKAALSEAHSVFRRLGTSAADRLAQSSARLRIVAQGSEREAGAPAEPRTAEQAELRQARVLPDLVSLSGAEERPNPEAEKHPVPRRKPQSSRTQERIEPETETLPGIGQMLVLDADRDPREPAKVAPATLSAPPERAAVAQDALSLSPNRAAITSPEIGSPQQGRPSREVCPGWVYRAACRKAQRRGEPLPRRAGVKWKRRSPQGWTSPSDPSDHTAGVSTR